MDLDLTDTSDFDSSQSDSDQDDGHLFDRSLEVARSPSQEDIVSLLECPVCFDLPLPPIKTCIRGHIICADCCCRLNKCPLCQQKIDIGRNFFAENFLNKSVIKSKFKVDGCNEELHGEKMKEHIQNCDFRPLKCKGCNAKVMGVSYWSSTKKLGLSYRNCGTEKGLLEELGLSKEGLTEKLWLRISNWRSDSNGSNRGAVTNGSSVGSGGQSEDGEELLK